MSGKIATFTGGMPWSKLRSTIRGLICPELRSRIDFHVTSYRHSHDGAEKVWVTIDGNRVLTSSWYQHKWYGWPRDPKGRLDWKTEFPKNVDKERDEVHLPQDVGEALRAYVDLPIGTALKSDNLFIRAMSIVDRRTGKRTLQAMQISDDDHSLIKAFYALRLSTIKPAAPES
jgi:hypothetical protein